MTIPIQDYETLKDSLLYGVSPQELPNKKQLLTNLGLLHKAAGFWKAVDPVEININAQWSWPEAHHFLETLLENKDKNIFYEWAVILRNQNEHFPANVLPKLLHWLIIDPEFAEHFIQLTGPAGEQLFDLVPEWHIFSSNSWKRCFELKGEDKKIFAFHQWRKSAPDAAFQYFMENYDQLKENTKLKCVRILQYGLNVKELNLIVQHLHTSKSAMQMEIVKLLLTNEEADYYKTAKEEFLKLLAHGELDFFQFRSPDQKKYKWNVAQKICCIPTSFINSKTQAIDYIKWCRSLQQEDALLNALQFKPGNNFHSWYFQDLLDSELLDENFPTAKLSIGLDHKLFNELCIQWIDQAGNALDLEAFLHFINSEKHFWSDELLAKLISIRNNPVLESKYDFTIFWQLLPYKINPNSIHLKSIPAECKIFENTLLNFDSIIQFRQFIRKHPKLYGKNHSGKK